MVIFQDMALHHQMALISNDLLLSSGLQAGYKRLTNIGTVMTQFLGTGVSDIDNQIVQYIITLF